MAGVSYGHYRVNVIHTFDWWIRELTHTVSCDTSFFFFFFFQFGLIYQIKSFIVWQLSELFTSWQMCEGIAAECPCHHRSGVTLASVQKLKMVKFRRSGLISNDIVGTALKISLMMFGLMRKRFG